MRKKQNAVADEEFRPINTLLVYEWSTAKIGNEKTIIKLSWSNNVLSEYQAGFRDSQSCESIL